MTAACTSAREYLSLELDHEVPDSIDFPISAQTVAHEHLAGCGDCRRFVGQMEAVRHSLRFEALGATPDVAGRVVELLVDERSEHAGLKLPIRWRVKRMMPAAACFVLGVLLGSLLVAERGAAPPSAAAGVPERVAAAQRSLRTLEADIEMHEFGWQAAVPARTFRGHLRYAAPESLVFSVRDTTAYPGDTWTPNDVDLVVNGDASWSQGLRACASPVSPACSGGSLEVTRVSHREPFDGNSVAPLDLLVPVRSFARANEPASLGSATINGRAAIGLVISAAQAAPLLDGLRPAGNLRAFYPTDRVELWLDETAFVPLSIRVTAGASDDRVVWAARRGFIERPNEVVFAVELGRVQVDGAVDQRALSVPPPERAFASDAGFLPNIDRRRAAARVEPAAIPTGMSAVRSGTVGGGDPGPTVIVRSWAAGRSWLKVRVTDEWIGGRLFGDMGAVVRLIALRDGSIAYANPTGTKVAIHGKDTDVVVEGSVSRDELVDVASSLGVVGQPVPIDWSEAAIATPRDAARQVPGFMILNGAPALGFGEPALRSDAKVVTSSYAGAGDRAFTLVASSGERLGPPLDVYVWGVTVRGVAGRYSSERGELEWVDNHVVYTLRSSTMSLTEMLEVAAQMSPP